MTPSLLYDVDDDGRNEEEAPDKSTTVDVDDHTEKERQTGKSCASAHADVETHDPDSEQGHDTTEHNNQDPNEHAGRSHDADSNPCLDEIQEDALAPWVDHITMRKADDLMAASGITSWILRQSLIYWRHAKMIGKHQEDRWTKLVSNWNPAISTRQQGNRQRGRPAKRWEDDLNIYSQPDGANRDNNDLASDMTWLTTAEDNAKGDSIHKQPTRPTATHHHNNDNPTNNTRPNNRYDQDSRPKKKDDTKDDDEQDVDDTPHLLSINRQLNLHYTKATTSRALVQTAATRVSHDTLTCVQHTSFPTQMQDHFISSGKRSERNSLFSSSFFALREFLSPTREGPRPVLDGQVECNAPQGISERRRNLGEVCTFREREWSLSKHYMRRLVWSSNSARRLSTPACNLWTGTPHT